MKATCLSTCGVGGHSSFMSYKKRSSVSTYLNTLYKYAITKDLKPIKKTKTKDNYDLYTKYENFEFENLDISVDSDS